MRVVATEKAPIKMWLEDIEDGALLQAKNVANLPFIFKHVALMSDCHLGFGYPIGSVVATKGVILIGCVGVDIGCGMISARSDIHTSDLDTDTIKKIMGMIREQVPTGFDHHQFPQSWCGYADAPDLLIINQELNESKKQLGTLGGGNHFIELQRDQDGMLRVMLHSGSRNFGFKIANYYHRIAKNFCDMWYSNIPDPDLAFLPIETQEAKDYLEAMKFALAFAQHNRTIMMNRIQDIIHDVIPTWFDNEINIHHNYANWENHYGKNVLVHRKGATQARLGQLGIIPGSQGTRSYIVEGLGNQESFMSSSHGAGRRMGRNEARKTLDLQSEIKLLDDKGIVHGLRNIKDLDEASSAYKDIDVVMENQKDLVKIVVALEPIAVIKAS